jgi:tol-pal system protein YbgF
MNVRIALLLCACSTACAELPPVVDKGGDVSSKATAAAPPASLTTTYEMMKRLEQMQGEVQQLTGKVEEQAFQIEELKKQQKTMYTDFDDRIGSIENKSGTGQPTAEAPADPSAPADSGVVEKEPTPTVATEQQASPEQPDSKQTPEPVAAPAAASNNNAPVQAATGSSSAQISDAEKKEYQQAYDDLRNGRTAQAITGLNAYIATHPDSAYASNAQYWLGEAHRVNQDNASARKAFNSVLEKHPKSEKVSDALLKLGYIEKDEKNIAKAREYLTRVTTEFPNSKAAKLAQKKLPMLVEQGQSAH